MGKRQSLKFLDSPAIQNPSPSASSTQDIQEHLTNEDCEENNVKGRQQGAQSSSENPGWRPNL